MNETPPRAAPNAAVLFAVQSPGIDDEEFRSSLDELERLSTTMGLQVVARVTQKRSHPGAGTVLGEGKLKELARITGGKGIVTSFRKAGAKKREDEGVENDVEDQADPIDDEDQPDETPTVRASVAVYDGEITPTQLKNLEQATGVEVLDRTGVILEIFHRHAHSREAKMQVEIAKLAYAAPRLRASHVGGDRQGGGIGGKGSGETAHELDKRRIRDRIAELRRHLEDIHDEHVARRGHRKEGLLASLVGYTNAGKSSLMRALTGSEVLVADKLFATLDTRVRALHPKAFPPVLVSDTVGFIKKLPHDLVASFRSTLDEAHAASLLLFTVDASDPAFRSQLEVTRTVLAEIDAHEIPSLLVLNKADRLTEEKKDALRAEYPDGVLMSAHDPADVDRLKERILTFFSKDLAEAELLLPYRKGDLLARLQGKARILSESYEAEGTRIRIRTFPDTLAWLKKEISED